MLCITNTDTRHGKTGGSGSGQFKQVILSGLKMGLSCESGWIGLTRIFHMNFFLYKENNMFLSFEKSCNKLLDVKCITLNSLLISRMNSVKLINTYSIILKLYKITQK